MLARTNPGLPPKQGLYDPANEHDACGVGFIANIAGEKSHRIVQEGIQLLVNLEHRGACGCDPETGDGAGLTIQIPDRFLRREAAALGIELPELGRYGLGNVMLAQDDAAAARQVEILEAVVAEEGQTVLGWRDVPHDPQAIGWQARSGLPKLRQIFIGATGAAATDEDAFERKLYVIRRLAEKRDGRRTSRTDHFFYVPSLSSRTAGLHGDADLTADQGLLHRRVGSRVRVCAVSRALPLQHEHPRQRGTSPIPFRYARAQRRDQHHRGQPELDEAPAKA